jgi:hypothetical protein
VIRLKVTIPAGLTLVYGKGPLRALLRKAGAEVAARAKALIAQRSRGKNKRTSAPGMPPISRTGTLANSIKVRPFRDGDGVSIRDVAFYALFLESGTHGGKSPGRRGGKGLRNPRTKFGGKSIRTAIVGTRNVPPHPFLSRALSDVTGADLERRIQDSVTQGVAFRRGKP